MTGWSGATNQTKMTDSSTIPFWKGTNFWLAVLLFVGSFFGLKEGTAQTVVMSIVGLIGAVGAVRQFLQSAKFGGWKETLSQPNTWNYLASVVALIGLPQAGNLIPALHDLSDALISGNWGLVITRGITLLTIVFYIFVKKPSA